MGSLFGKPKAPKKVKQPKPQAAAPPPEDKFKGGARALNTARGNKLGEASTSGRARFLS